MTGLQTAPAAHRVGAKWPRAAPLGWRISWRHWIAELGNHGYGVTGLAADESALRRKAIAATGPSRRTA
jgi:hypothetical protein